MPKLILTVDDSAVIRQTVSFTLRNAGYETVEASDGEDAVTKLAGKFDLIITDLNMPRMDGLGLIKHIRGNQGSNRYVPILVLTTESQASKKTDAKNAGATGWIVKPFRQDQLVAVVRKVLE